MAMMIGTSVMPRSMRSASEPVQIGQAEVEDHQVRGLGGDAAQSVQCRADRVHRHAPRSASDRSIAPPHHVIVFDEQHRGHAKTVLPLASDSPPAQLRDLGVVVAYKSIAYEIAPIRTPRSRHGALAALGTRTHRRRSRG
jgi:hypothetical protein